MKIRDFFLLRTLIDEIKKIVPWENQPAHERVYVNRQRFAWILLISYCLLYLMGWQVGIWPTDLMIIALQAPWSQTLKLLLVILVVMPLLACGIYVFAVVALLPEDHLHHVNLFSYGTRAFYYATMVILLAAGVI